MSFLKNIFIGKPKDPLSSKAHSTLALSIFFAWVGLGADGLSSACYGPEQSYLALGSHTALTPWLVIATAITVFILAFAYNRVISLFPNGGGGYKVASYLIGPYTGLVAGVALILDYILTIAISVASGGEAIFSMLNYHNNVMLQVFDTVIVLLLTYLNLRGMKESIKILLFIFVGFVILHAIVILYGIFLHVDHLPVVYHQAVTNYKGLEHQLGILFVSALLLHAYSQGGGTYTGLEAVSNNVNTLERPRVKTGQWTMLYMAISLSVMAGGILLLYDLWNVHPDNGNTLNAIVLRQIFGTSPWGHVMVSITLLFEAGLLFAAANTGFLGGPAVLSNMAVDSWVPKGFSNVSSRLVRQNGILFLGITALVLIYITNGRVSVLVIIYSMCVFLAFMLALSGLCRYYWNTQKKRVISSWLYLSLIGFGTLICIVIFLFVSISSFSHGSWIGLVLIAVMLMMCLGVFKAYQQTKNITQQLDQALCPEFDFNGQKSVDIDYSLHTAVIFVGNSVGVAMHTLLTIFRLFPHHYKNFVFVKIAVIDSDTLVARKKIKELREVTKSELGYLVSFCHKHGLAAEFLYTLAVDPTAAIEDQVAVISKKYSHATYYASQLIFPGANWIQKMLHNKTAFAIQRLLYSLGKNMMILPVRLNIERHD